MQIVDQKPSWYVPGLWYDTAITKVIYTCIEDIKWLFWIWNLFYERDRISDIFFSAEHEWKYC